MRIELEIPKEFEKDYTGDTFKDFFSRVLCDIDNKGMCGNYEKETAEMFIKAFDESKPSCDVDKVVEELEEYKRIAFINGTMGIDVANKMIEIVKAGVVDEMEK